jgi:hypothetical protein
MPATTNEADPLAPVGRPHVSRLIEGWLRLEEGHISSQQRHIEIALIG